MTATAAREPHNNSETANDSDEKVVDVRIRKRNGSLVSFDRDKIVNAIYRCFTNSCSFPKNKATRYRSSKVADSVCNVLLTMTEPVDIEDIQSAVETQLMAAGYHEAAKEYILYRREHERLREEAPIDELVVQAFENGERFFDGPLQAFQHYSKYARYDDELGRRETFPETVDRVMNHLRWHVEEKLEVSEDDRITANEWVELTEAVLAGEATGSMRLMQMAGPAARHEPIACYNCAFIGIRRLRDFSDSLYILMQGTGLGCSVEKEFSQELPKVKRQRDAVDVESFVVPDTTVGWCEAFRIGLEAWFSGRDLTFDVSKVRPKGARLRRKGGTASGPQPLLDLLSHARRTILGAQGRRLEPIEVYSIICKVGEIVQVGGVRRAALITIFDIDDHAMLTAKDGNIYADPARQHFSMSNNSVAVTEEPTDIWLLEFFANLGRKFTGEPGLFNRFGLRHQMPERRRRVYGQDHEQPQWGTNPCLVADTRLATSRGLVRVEDLADEGDPNIVVTDTRVSDNDVCGEFGSVLRPATQVELTQKNVPTVCVRTEHGHEVRCSLNHTFPTTLGDRRADELEPGDVVLLQSGEGRFGSPAAGTRGDGFVLGLFAGDGTSATTRNGSRQAFIDIWEDDFCLLPDVQENVVRLMSQTETYGVRSDYGDPQLLAQTATVEKRRIGGVRLARCFHDRFGVEDPADLKTSVPECVWRGSREMVVGYLRGLFAADGSVCLSGVGTGRTLSVRLSQSNREFLLEVQQLLQNFGIVSRVYFRREAGPRILPDGKGGSAEFDCRADYELIVSRPNAVRFEQEIGLPGRKGDELKAKLDERGRSCRKPERFISKIVAVDPAGEADVFCLNEPTTHSIIANGVITRQCGEILLHPAGQFCNLSLAIVRPGDSPSELERKVRLAARFGTLQASMTDFGYIAPEWRENCEREALLGVDLLGAVDNPLLQGGNDFECDEPAWDEWMSRSDLLTRLREAVIDENVKWAKRLGINPATSTTCIKPGGNSSLRWGTGQSMSGWYSEYMVRRVEVSRRDPIHAVLTESGVPSEVSPRDEDTSLFMFPMQAPKGSQIVNDLVTDAAGKVVAVKSRLSAVRQLNDWLAFKMFWTEHNPSVSIYYGQDELVEVTAWMKRHFDNVCGIALFPRSDGIYPGAPITPVTKDEYDELIAVFPDRIDWSRLLRYETHDQTSNQREFACAGGACSL